MNVQYINRFFCSIAEWRIALVFASCLWPGFFNNAQAAWHENYPQSGTMAHYVRLTGYGGDNAVNQQNLVISRNACVTRNTALGRPVAPFPSEAPSVIQQHAIEMYYTAQRVLIVKQGTLYTVNEEDCSLKEIPHHLLELRWEKGLCVVDLLKKQKRGICEGGVLGAAGLNQKALQVDLSKLPPELRKRAEAGLALLNQNNASTRSSPLPGLKVIGKKVLLSVPCSIYRNELANATFCVVTPEDSPSLKAHPVRDAPLNTGVPGILMEMNSVPLNLEPKKVRLNLPVSPDMFSIPNDLGLLPAGGAK